MAENCGSKYDPKIHFQRVKRLRRFSQNWKEEIFRFFEPESADMLIELLENPQMFTEEITLETYQKDNNLTIVDDDDSLDGDWAQQRDTSIRSLYHMDYNATAGRDTPAVAFNRMMKKFHDRVMSKLVFDLNTKRQIKVSEIIPEQGVDRLNYELLLYKKELLKRIAEFTNSSIDNISEESGELTKTINRVLSDYVNNKHAVGAEKVYDEFIILSNFDKLLESEFDWIKVKPAFKKGVAHGRDMYLYSDPKVKHRTSFDSDKMVGTNEQTSNYLKRLLDYIPVVDEEYNPIEWKQEDSTINWTVGFGNFERVITTIKDWLYNKPELESKFRKEYRKGADGDFDSIFNEYLSKAAKTSEFGTSLTGEARAIQKYLLGEDTDREIKELIVAQMYKTVECRYIVYDQQWDPNTKHYVLKRKTLRDHVVETQSIRLQTQIRSIAERYKNRIEDFTKLLTENGRERVSFDPETQTFTLSTGHSFIYKDENGYLKLIERDENSLQFFDRKWIIGMLRDLFNIRLPEDNIRQIEQLFGLSLGQIFLPPIMVAVSSVLDRNAYVFENDKNGNPGWKLRTWPYADSFANAAKYLGLIFGSESLNVLKDFNGNNLPVYQYGSLFFDIKDIADDIFETPGSVFGENEIVKDRSVLERIYLRSDTRFGGNISKAKEESVSDLVALSIFNDFYESLHTGKVLLQSTCFADKTKFPLFEINLRKLRQGDDHLQSILTEMAHKFNNRKEIEQMQDFMAKYRKSKVKKQLKDIYNRYAKVFSFAEINESLPYDIVISRTNSLLEHINRVTKSKLENIQEYFDKYNTKHSNEIGFVPIKFYPEYDITTDQNKKITFNEVVLNAASIYWDYDESNSLSKVKFQNRMQRETRQMAKAMRRNGFSINVFDNYALTALVNEFEKSDPDELKYWYNSVTGNLKTHRVFLEDGVEIFPSELELDEYYDDPSVTVILNPVIESWHYCDIAMAEQINDILFGDVSTYPNKVKNKNLLDSENYYLYGESNRLSTMFKRTMIGGSTRHKMIPTRFGAKSTGNVAFTSDFSDELYNIMGTESRDLTMDGCGFSSPEFTIMENWSYKDAAVGEDRKTIFGYTDPVTGVFTEVKWAVFNMSNLRRQNSIMSGDFSMEKMYERTHNIPLNAIDLNLSKFWNKRVSYDSKYIKGRSITSNKDLYKYDYKTGNYYKLIDLKSRLGKGEAVWEIVDSHGNKISGQTISDKRSIKSIYDIDQLLGGAFVYERDEESNSLVQTSLSSEIKATIICEMDWKDKIINYVIQHSATKSGVSNPNKVYNENGIGAFFRNASGTLQYTQMPFQYGGVQMDASHDVTGGDVSELMQAVAAMAQNGYRMDAVNDLYEAIGHVTLSGLKPVLKARKEGDDKELLIRMGKALVDSFKSGSKDTLGLAQSFMDVAESILGTDSFNGIPFSAPTIVGSFLAEMASMLNRKGIRRRYSGLGTVQAPSHGFMLHYSIGNKTMSFKEFAEWIHNSPDILNALKNEKLKPSIFTNEDPVERLLYDQMLDEDWKITNPLIKRVGPGFEKGINDITFEDTVVIRKKGFEGLGEVVKINSIQKYDKVKHFYPENEYEIYVWEGKGRNLASANTKITYTGFKGDLLTKKEISLYDIDVVRSLYYLNHLKDGIELDINEYRTIVSAIGSAIDNSRKPLEEDFDKWIKEFVSDPDVTISKENKTKLINLLQRELTRINLELSDLYNNKKTSLDVLSQDCFYDTYNFNTEEEFNLYVQNPELTTEDYVNLLYYAKRRGYTQWLTNPVYTEEQLFRINTAKQYISKINIIKVSTIPPEISVGKIFLKQFGLKPSDNLNVIDENFFFNKYKDFSKLPNKKELPSDKFDGMFYTSEGKRLFVTIGSNNLKRMEGFEPKASSMETVGEKIYYGDDELCSSNRKLIRHYVNNRGETFDFIVVETLDDVREIQNSGIFQGLRANYTTSNWKDLLKLQFPNVIDELGDIEGEINLYYPSTVGTQFDYNNQFIGKTLIGNLDNYGDEIVPFLIENDNCYQWNSAKIKAHNTMLSFIESLNFIGARIPTQSMQSFSTASVKVFADTMTNECYMPKNLTWIEGSDYDIDKWYLMGLEILSNGLIATHSDISFEIGVRNAAKLPIPSGRTFVVQQIENTPVNDIAIHKTAVPSEKDPAKLLTVIKIQSEFGECQLTKNTENGWRLLFNSKKISRREMRRLLNVALQNIGQDELIAVQDISVARMLSEKGCMYLPEVNPYQVINRKAEPTLITQQDIDFLEKDGIPTGLLKALSNSNTNLIVFEDGIFPNEKVNFLKLLNKHESTNLSDHRLNTALRNKVFFAMQNVLLDPASQISLQMPIAIAAPKKAAEASELGKQSLTMTMDNSLVKFEMQIENMSGKTGVGTAANALKAFFGASTYFNNKLYEIDNLLRKLKVTSDISLGDEIWKRIKLMVFDSKLDFGSNKLVTIGDLYWIKIINTCKELGITHIPIGSINLSEGQKNLDSYLTTGGFAIYQLANDLQDLNEQMNSADAISAMISAATDNAKELVLAKINATGPLLDVWCHLLATGHTFEEIAEKMCSKTTNIVSRLLKKSIFNTQSKWFTPEKIINFLLGNDELISTATFDSAITHFNDETNDPSFLRKILLDPGEELTEISKSIREEIIAVLNLDSNIFNSKVYAPYQVGPIIREALIGGESRRSVSNIIQNYMRVNSRLQSEFQKWLEKTAENKPVIRETYSSEDEIPISEYLESYYTGLEYAEPSDPELEGYGSIRFIRDTIDFDSIPGSELSILLRYFEEYCVPKYQLMSGDTDINWLKSLKNDILPACEEMSMYAKWLGVNKGVKTDDYEEYHWIQQFTAFINKRYIKADKANEFKPFDFLTFIKDSEYRKEQIAQYEQVKSTQNLLAMVSDADHFWAMLELVELNRFLIEHAAVIKLERKLADEILRVDQKSDNKINEFDTKTLGKQEFGKVREFASKILAFNWISRLKGLSINTKGFHYPIGSWETKDIDGTDIQVNTITGLANFKKLMDDYIIPELIKRNRDNPFFQGIVDDIKEDSVTKRPIKFWKPNIQMNDISSSQKTQTLYEAMLKGFSEVKDEYVGRAVGFEFSNNDWTIGDLFFLYDFYVNRNGFGNSAFTRFFEDTVRSENKYSLINNYYDFLRRVDNGEIQFEEIVYDIRDLQILLSVQPGSKNKFKSALKNGRVEFYNEDGHETENGITYDYDPSDFMFGLWFMNGMDVISPADKNGIVYDGHKLVTIDPSDREVIEVMVHQIEKMIGNANVPIQIITDEDLIDMRLNQTLTFNDDLDWKMTKESDAFINNGTVYININKRKFESTIHEVMHIICAAMKYDPKYTNKYYEWVNDVWSSPFYKSMRDTIMQKYETTDDNGKPYYIKSGSDLKEELFAEVMADRFRSKFSKGWGEGPSRKAEIVQTVVKILNDILGTDIDSDIEPSELGNTTLKNVLNVFNTSLFSSDNAEFVETIIPINQKLATIKKLLIKKGIIEYDCY